ncbi:protein disulfide-isomerase A6 [Pseudophryne corroboree]|uniref:protein disulfide-isomerase A6 n=1 Tax=Pseudophryne corroboree TaxID=495146 RepID=UPI003081B6E7
MDGTLLGAVICSLFLAVNCVYTASDDVVTLTPSNFNKEVIQSDSLWLVEFYAPWCGHCKALTPEWKKAATALTGIVKLGAVDCDQHKSLGSQYSVRGYPTIKVFGANKNKPEEYSGGRTSESIVDSAINALRAMAKDRLSGRGGGSESGKQQRSSSGGSGGSKKDVVELTDDNFDKQVLNGEDVWLVEFYAPWCGHCKNLEPEWAAAASEVNEQTKGRVKLGAVDATVHQGLASRYGVSSTKIEHVISPMSQLSCGFIAGAAGRNAYLEVMLKMADRYKKKMWGWLWTEAGAQLDLETSLGIGGFGYPAMAAVNARKMKFALLKGSFSEQGINEFLRELSFGRGSTSPVGGGAIPKINTVEAWDGKDGELPAEDDIDLSDVELDDFEKDEL